MTAVMIGVDPAKRSHAMAVLDGTEEQLAALQVLNDSAGYRDMLRLAKRWPDRTWAVEGAGGVGVQLAQRLVADGERVIDVPPKLSTRARMFDVGHGRKNDPVDARTVAVVALRTKNLRPVVLDDEMVAIRLLSERRCDLVQSRTSTVNQLHQLLMELIPAGAERNLTASKAKTLLATVRPRDVAGKTRRQVAADLIDDVAALDKKLKDINARLKTAVEATGTTITTVKGIGVATAAMILGEVGDVRRFPSRNHFATYTGTAPREVSSGEIDRHRLSRAGNRQLNHALHIAAMMQQAHRPARQRLLRQEDRRRQRQEGRTALPQATAVRRGVPPARRRPEGTRAAEPGWASGDDSSIQRGRLTPRCQHFGAATHRAPTATYSRAPSRLLTQRGAVTWSAGLLPLGLRYPSLDDHVQT